MNILMLHPHDIYSSDEPWTIRIKSIAREFKKRGHSVKLAYYPLKFTFTRVHPWEGIEIIPLFRGPGPRTFLINIRRLIKLGRWADIIHFQKCHHYCSIPAVITAYINHKPIHYDWDDWEEGLWYVSTNISRRIRNKLHALLGKYFFRLLEKLLPKLVDTVSTSSHRLREKCLSLGVKADRIFDSPVGADLEKFNLENSGERIRKIYGLDKKKLVLYLGHLHGGQYIELFIKAARIVFQAYPGIMFMIVGEGDRFPQLKKLTIDLGIEHKIIFTHAVSHELIPSYTAAADICVASFEDNEITRCKSPLKLVEYLASGKVIVASSVGEVRNMVGGVGILVKPGDYKDLAKGIMEALSDKTLPERVKLLARRRAESKYNWSVTAGNILRAYEKAGGFNRLKKGIFSSKNRT